MITRSSDVMGIPELTDYLNIIDMDIDEFIRQYLIDKLNGVGFEIIVSDFIQEKGHRNSYHEWELCST